MSEVVSWGNSDADVAMMADSRAGSPLPTSIASIPGPRGTTIAPVRLSGGRVSGILHAPGAKSPESVGIICPPILYEYQLCHRTLRSLAERLAAVGALVLRLDYRGTGDSSAEPDDAGLDSWCEDVKAGARFLAGELGHSPTFYFGLRVGARVALESAIVNRGTDDPAPAVVAWAPIFDGSAYAAELERTHAVWFDRYLGQHRADADRASRTGQVLGQPWPRGASARLESLAPPSPGACQGPVTLVETDGQTLSATERAALEAAAPRLTTLRVEGPAPWRQDPEVVSPPVPARSLEAIVDCIRTEVTQ